MDSTDDAIRTTCASHSELRRPPPHVRAVVEKEEAAGENDATGRLLVAVTVAVDRRRFTEAKIKNLAFWSNASPGTNDQ